MDEEHDESKTVDATERTLEIIAELKEQGGLRVTELSEALDMSKSSIHSHLTTLLKHKYVVKQGDEYQLSLQFLDIAEHVRQREQAFRITKPKVKMVAEETGEVASLMAEDHGRGIFVYRHNSSSSPRPTTVGNQAYLHATAGGKAILSRLPEEEVDRIIDKWGLPAVTEHTITDREELYEELDEICDRGVAFNDQEDIMGLRAVAAPIMNANNQVAGSLSVYGPAHRMRGDFLEQEVPDLLLETVNDIQLDITFNKRQE